MIKASPNRITKCKQVYTWLQIFFLFGELSYEEVTFFCSKTLSMSFLKLICQHVTYVLYKVQLPELQFLKYLVANPFRFGKFS